MFFNGSILKVIQCYVWVAREGHPNFFVEFMEFRIFAKNGFL